MALKYFETATAYTAANPKDSDVCFVEDESAIYTHGEKFGGSGENGNAKIFYGTCSTDSTSATKIVVCNDFTSSDLVNGTAIYVTFTASGYTATSTVYLNVNNTGTKAIKKYTTVDNYIKFEKNVTYLFVYSSTNGWYRVDDGNNLSIASFSCGTGYTTPSNGIISLDIVLSSASTGWNLKALKERGFIISFRYNGGNTYPTMPANVKLQLSNAYDSNWTVSAANLKYLGENIKDGVVFTGDMITCIYDGSDFEIISIERPEGTYHLKTNGAFINALEIDLKTTLLDFNGTHVSPIALKIIFFPMVLSGTIDTQEGIPTVIDLVGGLTNDSHIMGLSGTINHTSKIDPHVYINYSEDKIRIYTNQNQSGYWTITSFGWYGIYGARVINRTTRWSSSACESFSLNCLDYPDGQNSANETLYNGNYYFTVDPSKRLNIFRLSGTNRNAVYLRMDPSATASDFHKEYHVLIKMDDNNAYSDKFRLHSAWANTVMAEAGDGVYIDSKHVFDGNSSSKYYELDLHGADGECYAELNILCEQTSTVKSGYTGAYRNWYVRTDGIYGSVEEEIM